MENQSITLDKMVKISIIAGAMIVALSVAYYLVSYIPQRDKEKVEQQEKERGQAKKDLQNCLNTAPSWNYKTEICFKQYPQ